MSTVIENEAFWQEHSEKLKSSGLPRSKYCREHGIDYDKFGYWLRKLSPAPSGFVPIKVQSPTVSDAQPILCTIELGGHALKIHDASALSILLERLA